MMRRWIWIVLLVAWPSRCILSADDDAGNPLWEFQQRQPGQLHAAQADRKAVEAKIAKIQELRAGLSLPADQNADRKLAQELAYQQEALERVQERISVAERTMNGEYAGVLSYVNGTVQKSKGEQSWEPATTESALFVGDTLRTGEQSDTLLMFGDGTRIKLAPDTRLTLKAKNAIGATYVLGGGKIHVVRIPQPFQGIIGQVQFETTSASLQMYEKPVQFDLWLDGEDKTHLRVTSGRATATALPMERTNMSPPWWLPPTSDVEMTVDPLIYGKWFRLTAMKGDVRLVREDGIERKAVVGAELSYRQALRTGADGTAWGMLNNLATAAIKSSSRMTAVQNRKAVTYDLSSGTFHFSGTLKTQDAAGWVFRSAAQTVSMTDGEFAVDVSTGGADVLILAGTLIVTGR